MAMKYLVVHSISFLRQSVSYAALKSVHNNCIGSVTFVICKLLIWHPLRKEEREPSRNYRRSYNAGHKKQKPQNHEYIDVHLEQMSNVDFSSIEKAIKLKKVAADILRPIIHAHFSTYYQEIIGATVWLNPNFGTTATKCMAKQI